MQVKGMTAEGGPFSWGTPFGGGCGTARGHAGLRPQKRMRLHGNVDSPWKGPVMKVGIIGAGDIGGNLTDGR